MPQPIPRSRSSAVVPAARARAPSLGVVGAVAGLAAYLVVFLFTPGRGGAETRRGEYLLVALLRPDDILQNWFAGATLAAVAERCAILAVAAAVLAVAAAAGWLSLRIARVDRLVTRLEMTLLAVAVGLNLVSLFTLALGLAGMLRRDLFLVAGTAVCIASAATRRLAGCSSGTCQLAVPATPPADALQISRHWLWLLVPFSLAIVAAALLPPLDFDVREYHLQAPKEFFQDGAVTFLPHNVYANMPLGAEMLALFAMVLTGDWWTGALAGKVLIALYAPLAALLIYAAGARLASPAAGILAAAVYVSIPWVAIVSTHGLIEGALACYLLASLFCVLIWQHALRDSSAERLIAGRGLLAIAGFLAGASVATKYPAVVFCAVPLTAYVIVVAVRQWPPAKAALGVSIFLLGLFAGCGLWFAKNAVFTGNPTYPLLAGWFASDLRTPEQQAQWNAAHAPPNFQPSDLFRRAADVLLLGMWISPLVAPLAGLALAFRWRLNLVALLALAILYLFFSWWLLTHRIDRFLVPVWPLAALLAGIGAASSNARLWRRALLATAGLGLAYCFVLVAGGAVADNRYLMPLDVLRAESLQRVNPWHAYLNQHRDEIDRVLLVGDAQPFDLEVPADYNTVFDASLFEQIARDRTPAEVQQQLHARGISHVFVDWPEIDRYRSPGNYGITEYLEPAVFDDLVAAGVLEELPMLADHRGQMFRVCPLAH